MAWDLAISPTLPFRILFKEDLHKTSQLLCITSVIEKNNLAQNCLKDTFGNHRNANRGSIKIIEHDTE